MLALIPNASYCIFQQNVTYFQAKENEKWKKYHVCDVALFELLKWIPAKDASHYDGLLAKNVSDLVI